MGHIGVEGGKGTSGKKKGQCSQGDRCSFRHDTQARSQDPEHTAATPSEPTVSRGRSVSRTRSIRGKSNDWSILRQPCRYYLRGTCTRTSCEYWHPPEFQFYESETGCKAGDKCLFPHYKVVEQPNKKAEKELLPKKKRNRRQECCGYREKCITIGLCSTRFRCIGFSWWKVSGKPDAKSLGTNSKGTIHEVYATSSEYPGKERTIVGKINAEAPHQRSHHAMKFEDRSHEETERQRRCARSKAWNLAKNKYKLKQKDEATFYFPRRNGYPRLRQQKSRRRGSL